MYEQEKYNSLSQRFHLNKSTLDLIMKDRMMIDECNEVLRTMPDFVSRPIMVPLSDDVNPIGIFEGRQIHTNDLLHRLHCGFFVSKTVKDACSYIQRKMAENEDHRKRLLFQQNTIAQSVGELEILDNIHCADDELAKWRTEHKKNVAAYKKLEATERMKAMSLPAEGFFERLDELEAQEIGQ